MTHDTFQQFLRATGNLGPLIADFDWSTTNLGPIDMWPATTRAAVGTMLRSPIPLVSLWGSDGTMVYNDAYARFADARHPALLGARVREGWPEVASFNDHVMRTVLGGGTLQYVNQELTLYRTGKAEQVWMNLDYGPIVDETGSPIGVIAVVTETTTAVLAERKIANETTRLSTMFDQAPGFVAMLEGPDHRFTLINRAYSALVAGREVLGKPVREALPEAAKQGFVTLLDRIYATGEPYFGYAVPLHIEATSTTPEQFSYVDFIYQPLVSDEGETFGIFVQGTDVTAKVEAERAAEESATKFDTLAQVVPDHMWIADAQGDLIWLNDRTYQYAGVAQGSLNGEAWQALVHPDDVSRVGHAWANSISTGADYAIDFRIRRFDGEYRWHLVRAAAVVNSD